MTRSERSREKQYAAPLFLVEIFANGAKFYNAVLFMGSVAVFSLIAQKLNAGK